MSTGRDYNYGIALLRCVSMYMICILHIIGHGGIIANTSGSATFSALLLNVACYGAVDCFALISGYLGIQQESRYAKLGKLWLQVSFYSLVFFVIFSVGIHADFDSIRPFIRAILPICSRQYWYFTAYFIMILAIPQLNMVANQMECLKYRNFLWIFFFIFCIAPCFNFLIGLTIPMSFGFSPIWLGYLYLLGIGIRKYGILYLFPAKLAGKLSDVKHKNVLAFCLYFAVTLIAYYIAQAPHKYSPHNMVTYTSPLIVLGAVAFLYIFAHLHVHTACKKHIKSISPFVFGVYLIHDNIYIRENLIKNLSSFVKNLPTLSIIPTILLIAIAIFYVCITIDYFRSKFFVSVKKFFLKFTHEVFSH